MSSLVVVSSSLVVTMSMTMSWCYLVLSYFVFVLSNVFLFPAFLGSLFLVSSVCTCRSLSCIVLFLVVLAYPV